VQQAAGAVQAQAPRIVKTTKGKVAERVPKLTETRAARPGPPAARWSRPFMTTVFSAKNSHDRNGIRRGLHLAPTRRAARQADLLPRAVSLRDRTRPHLARLSRQSSAVIKILTRFRE